MCLCAYLITDAISMYDSHGKNSLYEKQKSACALCLWGSLDIKSYR